MPVLAVPARVTCPLSWRVAVTLKVAVVPAFTRLESSVANLNVATGVVVPVKLTTETVVIVVLAAYAGSAEVATTAGTVHAAPAKTVRRLKPLWSSVSCMSFPRMKWCALPRDSQPYKPETIGTRCPGQTSGQRVQR